MPGAQQRETQELWMAGCSVLAIADRGTPCVCRRRLRRRTASAGSSLPKAHLGKGSVAVAPEHAGSALPLISPSAMMSHWEQKMAQQQKPESQDPDVLEYASAPDSAMALPTVLERGTAVLNVVGVIMFLITSVVLDGGRLWTVTSVLFGMLMIFAGLLVVIAARWRGRPVRPSGVAALILGVAMAAFGIGSMAAPCEAMGVMNCFPPRCPSGQLFAVRIAPGTRAVYRWRRSPCNGLPPTDAGRFVAAPTAWRGRSWGFARRRS